ncbi:MAG: hypothetical protein ACHQIM_10945 [Sphingobacteriales bacterium]
MFACKVSIPERPVCYRWVFSCKTAMSGATREQGEFSVVDIWVNNSLWGMSNIEDAQVSYPSVPYNYCHVCLEKTNTKHGHSGEHCFFG